MSDDLGERVREGDTDHAGFGRLVDEGGSGAEKIAVAHAHRANPAGLGEFDRLFHGELRGVLSEAVVTIEGEILCYGR